MNDSDIVIPNGSHLSSLRKSCGLTQADLAKETGYSVRLIGKTEQGQGVRYSSLIAIATTLSRKGATVSASELCSDPEAIVRQFVEAYRLHEENMVEKIRHLLSPDLEVFIAGDEARIPFAGTYSGPDGLQEFWNRFFGLLERPDKNALNLTYYTNANEVVAYGTERGRIRGTIADDPTWLSLLFRIEDGLIVRFEDYFDTATAQFHVDQFRKGIQQWREGDDESLR
ncbi:helix-turn-helix domain-containing protein [Stieleria sp. JC731]|uniref:helix-turn-helix domain-containing protein n=1 Tax=Pirellulaceae TaxID=2691357 RepID=UPI001E3132F9|nr:helix-turn-helix domain-containing protein [Stieleria sp. JC731]MCC9600292.1 helix-turn-helix domain-containing protein [Stieleria sp. JC731]